MILPPPQRNRGEVTSVPSDVHVIAELYHIWNVADSAFTWNHHPRKKTWTVPADTTTPRAHQQRAYTKLQATITQPNLIIF
jgi:hypothetical protein